MRLPVLSLLVAASALAGASHTASAQSAYSYPWCAKYYGKLEGTACYYKSYQQCMATISGVGGYCYERAPITTPPAPPARGARAIEIAPLKS